MKVLRSRRRPPLCVGSYWANTERKEVFFLAQLLMRNLHTGLASLQIVVEVGPRQGFEALSVNQNGAIRIRGTPKLGGF